MDPRPFAFVATRCALQRSAPRVAVLAHVVALVDAFLDVSTHINLASTARIGSVRLFDQVAQRIDACDEPRERYFKYAQAMECAIASGSLAIVKSIHHRHPDPLPVSPMRVAARCGKLEILQWLFEHRRDETCTPRAPGHYPRGSLTCCLNRLVREAVDGCHHRVLRWLAEQGCVGCDEISVTKWAATQGDLEMIKWLHHSHGSFSAAVMDEAARHGHIAVVQFLHRHRKEGCSPLALIYAIVYDHDEVAAYLRDTALCSDVEEGIVLESASAGRVDLLEKYAPRFIHGKNCVKMLRRALTSALMAQRLPVLQWLHHEQHVTGMPVAMAISEKPVDLNVIQWIHDTKCGHWTTDVLKLAIEHDHVALMRWLHAHGRDAFDGTRLWMIDTAALNGHLEVIQVLHELYPNQAIGSEMAMDNAGARGHLHVVQWLHTHRTEGCSLLALDNAIDAGQRDVAKWLFEHRPECNAVHPYRSIEEVELALERHDRSILVYFQKLLDDPVLLNERQRRELFAHCTLSGHLYAVQWLAARLPESFNAEEVQIVAEGACHPHIVAWIQGFVKPETTTKDTTTKAPSARQAVAQWLRRWRRGSPTANEA